MGNFYRDRVLSGIEPVKRVFESENILAFEHTNPSYPVHIVVIPKKEIDSLLDLPTDGPMLAEMMNAIKHVADDVLRTHRMCRIVTNLGEYQDTEHLHWHVISGAMMREPNGQVGRLECQ